MRKEIVQQVIDDYITPTEEEVITALIDGLKNHRENVVAWVQDNLIEWMTVIAFQNKGAIAIYDYPQTAEDIVCRLEEIHADKLK